MACVTGMLWYITTLCVAFTFIICDFMSEALYLSAGHLFKYIMV